MSRFVNEYEIPNIRGDFLLNRRNGTYGYANVGQLFWLGEIAACAKEVERYLQAIGKKIFMLVIRSLNSQIYPLCRRKRRNSLVI